MWNSSASRSTESERTPDATPAGSLHYHPTPSPDGRWLAYGSKRDGVRQLYVMRLKDKQTHRLTDLKLGRGSVAPLATPSDRQLTHPSLPNRLQQAGEPKRMWTRREFLGTAAAAAATAPWTLSATGAEARPARRMAIVTAAAGFRLAWPAHGRAVPGRLSDQRPLAQAAARRRLALCRSTSQERPEPGARRGVRLPHLSHDRRGALLRRRQAGGRRRADHRRARQLPATTR